MVTGLDDAVASRLSQGTVAMKMLQPVDGVVQMAEQLVWIPLGPKTFAEALGSRGRCASTGRTNPLKNMPAVATSAIRMRS